MICVWVDERYSPAPPFVIGTGVAISASLIKDMVVVGKDGVLVILQREAETLVVIPCSAP